MRLRQAVFVRAIVRAASKDHRFDRFALSKEAALAGLGAVRPGLTGSGKTPRAVEVSRFGWYLPRACRPMIQPLRPIRTASRACRSPRP
ncbi:hypothetical protein ASF53_11325 [Methylobacterium sp. Leaf123]|nr:hypothetical protein ASF53_11325 [Methylobacterium sp. Leaf123]